MKAVVIDSNGEVFALLKDEDVVGRLITFAGAVTKDGAPVNAVTLKVSRSARNLERARKSDAQFVTRRSHGGFVFFTL